MREKRTEPKLTGQSADGSWVVLRDEEIIAAGVTNAHGWSRTDTMTRR
jgi:hypothetical protein